MHRPMLVYRMPHLIVIDGIPVSDEERTKAEIYFMEQQVGKKMSVIWFSELAETWGYNEQSVSLIL